MKIVPVVLHQFPVFLIRRMCDGGSRIAVVHSFAFTAGNHRDVSTHFTVTITICTVITAIIITTFTRINVIVVDAHTLFAVRGAIQFLLIQYVFDEKWRSCHHRRARASFAIGIGEMQRHYRTTIVYFRQEITTE